MVQGRDAEVGLPTGRVREGERESTEWRENGKKRGKRDGMGNKVRACGQQDRDKAGDSGGWRQTMPCKGPGLGCFPLLSRRPPWGGMTPSSLAFLSLSLHSA